MRETDVVQRLSAARVFGAVNIPWIDERESERKRARARVWQLHLPKSCLMLTCCLYIDDITDVVMRLCKKVEPSFLFSVEPSPLTEPVILSLIAQLTTELNEDTDFKITYLQEATMKINPQDPQT